MQSARTSTLVALLLASLLAPAAPAAHGVDPAVTLAPDHLALGDVADGATLEFDVSVASDQPFGGVFVVLPDRLVLDLVQTPPAGYVVSVGTLDDGRSYADFVGSGAVATALEGTFTLQATAQGFPQVDALHAVDVTVRDPLDSGEPHTTSVFFYVDASPPDVETFTHAPDHADGVWTNDPEVALAWTVTEVCPAGFRTAHPEPRCPIEATVTLVGPETVEVELPGASGSTTVELTEGGAYVLDLAARDEVGLPGAREGGRVNLDLDDPMVDPVADVVEEATSPAGADVIYATPDATDATSGAGPVTCVPASGTTFPLGDTEVACTATDLAGNEGETTFRVTVEDTTPPEIDAVADILDVEAEGPDGAPVTFDAPTWTDAVDGSGLAACDATSGDVFPLGETLVTCGVADAEGNAAENAIFTVSVVDTTPPEIAATDDLRVPATSLDGAVVTYDAPATFDLVDGAGVADCAPASGAEFDYGTTTVTCTAVDLAGNEATSEFDVLVLDADLPTLVVPEDFTVEATGPDGAAVDFEVSATDALDVDVDVTCTAASGDTFPLGATLVECTATDDEGNEAVGAFTVTVEDTVGPAIDPAGDVLDVEAEGPDGASVTFDAPAWTDAVDGAGVATCDAASGDTFPLGTTRVTCTAEDAAGNLADDVTFTVTVVDTTPPLLDDPSDISAEASSGDGASVDFTVPAWTDAVDGAGLADCDAESGDTFPLGTTTIACSAEDAAGNLASVEFDVLVEDTTPPAFTTVPTGEVTVEATRPDGAVLAYDVASEDLVDGAVAPDCTPAEGSVVGFLPDLTRVDCTATDAAGNAATASFFVYAVDRTGPALPAGFAAKAFGKVGTAPAVTAVVTDAVGVTSQEFLLETPSGFAPPVAFTGTTFTPTLTGLPDGDYAVLVLAEDAAGNALSATVATFTLDRTLGSGSGSAPGGSKTYADVDLEGPTKGVVGEKLTFKATGTPRGLEFEWDFGDGADATGATVTHAFAKAGRYEVEVTGDKKGVEEDVAKITVRIVEAPATSADAPEPDIDGPSTADVGDAARFEVADAPEGADVAWDLGDGTTAAGAEVAHAYDAPGTYAVVASVDGEELRHTIVVRAPEPDVEAVDATTLEITIAFPGEVDVEDPFVGSLVRLEGPDGAEVDLVRDSGRVRFDADEAGTYTLTVEASGSVVEEIVEEAIDSASEEDADQAGRLGAAAGRDSRVPAPAAFLALAALALVAALRRRA